ncbi:MAG TPA: hypothetical protein PLH43_04735 [Acetivibrio sp.]|uniref:hypothetical protein n=1 Tax=Acetivibrio sp. TaxID=1872092 RepID=UPI002B69F70D|nr:hypothetical protein [Acetivibrio sp.]HOM02116.1 hypothetical protein [Acetivibrio sp.]
MEPIQHNKQLISKFNEIQEEILRIGWNGIIQKYHPDINCDDENSAKVFKMYKSIYENMRKRVIVNP